MNEVICLKLILNSPRLLLIYLLLKHCYLDAYYYYQGFKVGFFLISSFPLHTLLENSF